MCDLPDYGVQGQTDFDAPKDIWLKSGTVTSNADSVISGLEVLDNNGVSFHP